MKASKQRRLCRAHTQVTRRPCQYEDFYYSSLAAVDWQNELQTIVRQWSRCLHELWPAAHHHDQRLDRSLLYQERGENDTTQWRYQKLCQDLSTVLMAAKTTIKTTDSRSSEWQGIIPDIIDEKLCEQIHGLLVLLLGSALVSCDKSVYQQLSSSVNSCEVVNNLLRPLLHLLNQYYVDFFPPDSLPEKEIIEITQLVMKVLQWLIWCIWCQHCSETSHNNHQHDYSTTYSSMSTRHYVDHKSCTTLQLINVALDILSLLVYQKMELPIKLWRSFCTSLLTLVATLPEPSLPMNIRPVEMRMKTQVTNLLCLVSRRLGYPAKSNDLEETAVVAACALTAILHPSDMISIIDDREEQNQNDKWCYNKLFQLQCHLQLKKGRSSPCPGDWKMDNVNESEVLAPVIIDELYRIALQYKVANEPALAAAACLSLMAQAGYCSTHHLQALVNLMVEGRVDIKRIIIPGLWMYFQNNPIDYWNVITQGSVNKLKRLISSGVEIVTRPAKNVFHFERQVESTSAKFLFTMISYLTSNSNPDTHNVPFHDLMSILLVLIDCDNNQVVYNIAICLCNELQDRAAANWVMKCPELLVSQASVIGRLPDQRDVANAIVESWYEILIKSSDDVLATTFTRQPSVIKTLVQLIKTAGDSGDVGTQRTAICIIMVLSNNACNRRILARQSGLIPCLVCYLRTSDSDYTGDSDEQHDNRAGFGSESINIDKERRSFSRRHAVKQRIMELATLL